MKRFLAYFCCIFTLLGQSFSCLANDNIVGSTEAGNILYQDSAIILRANSNMSVVECENNIINSTENVKIDDVLNIKLSKFKYRNKRSCVLGRKSCSRSLV